MDEETFERITATKAKEKGLERIQLLDEDTSTPNAASKDDGKSKSVDTAVQRKSSVKKSKKAKPASSSESATPIRTPKHEFRIIKSEVGGKRNSFVMTISLPEEVGNRYHAVVPED